MTTKLRQVLIKERIPLILLHATIAKQVKKTDEKTIDMANLSRIITGKQEKMWESTLERILKAINYLRKFKDTDYKKEDILEPSINKTNENEPK